MTKKNALKILFLGACICFLLGAFTFIFLLVTTPKVEDISLAPDGYRTSILDDKDHIVRTVAGVEANRVYVKLDQIPQNVSNAFIAIEDERFYNHHGVDVKGVVRAMVKGVTSGSLSQGGSTITQQLMKNNVFTSWTEEKHITDKVARKIREMFLAMKVERVYSKENILENYLNTINLGKGSWGVEAASYLYFDKDVEELSLAEASLLAGITKNPSGYNPIDHPEKCLERQKSVLVAMENQGYINEEQRKQALKQSENLYKEVAEHYGKNNASSAYSYFEDALFEEVKHDLMSEYEYTADEAWEKIYRGGLTIHSTQHTKFQEICESVSENDQNFSNGQQISIVMMDTSSGAVKAIIGGRGKKEESLSLNRAISSERQPGSTLKVIGEYAAGLDTGAFTLATTYDDAKMNYSNGEALRNAGDVYSGKITVSQAIADSKNTIALKCFQQVGSETVVEYLERFGLTSLSSNKEGESLALGGTYGGVTNLQMTAAYNAIANGGVYTNPYFYEEVVDHDGTVLLQTTDVQNRAVNEETAQLLTCAMQGVLNHGTGTVANFSGMSLAGKSGTTTKMKDLWFVGFSPYYSCGVWGGYDDNREQTDSTYVKKIWKSVMQQTHANYKNKSFTANEQLNPVAICTKCGKRAAFGLCDSTVQGNMTSTEYFVAGTEPSESCDCHIAVEKCSASGMLKGHYCPSDCMKTVVYLKEGTEGTLDADYVKPENGETCNIHKDFIDKFFGGTEKEPDEAGSGQNNSEQNSDHGNNNHWYTNGYWGDFFR